MSVSSFCVQPYTIFAVYYFCCPNKPLKIPILPALIFAMKELKKLILLFLLGAVLSLASVAQNSGCDGDRFLHPVFDSVIVVSDVIYGNNITIKGEYIDLKMDIYEPFMDTLSLRPVVFIVHGGGFTSGSKSGFRNMKLSKNYARRGYIAVSIDYRLYDLDHAPDSFLLKDAIVRGMSDLKAAMRYMIEDNSVGNAYKVDTNNFFLYGVSSGAIIANTAAYLDELNEADEQLKELIIQHGGMPGNSNPNVQYDPEIKAVINSSGGLFNYYWMDEDDPSLLSIHCALDPVMPYLKDWLVIMSQPVIEAYGSYYMDMRAEATGIDHELIIVPGEMHLQYYYDSLYYDSLMNTSSAMFQDIICSDSGGGISVAIGEPEELSSSSIYPNPADQYVMIKGLIKGELEIYSSSGALLRKENLSGPNINVQELKAGMYFLIIRDGQVLHRHKLLISR